jgi:hypothetical protein
MSTTFHDNYLSNYIHNPKLVVKLIEFHHAYLAIYETRNLAVCGAFGTKPKIASIATICCPAESTMLVAAPFTFPKVLFLGAYLAQMSTAVGT